MKEFLEAIERNPDLKAKVEALKNRQDAIREDLIALAKEYGFDLSEKDLPAADGQTRNLNDDELEAVAAGVAPQSRWILDIIG